MLFRSGSSVHGIFQARILEWVAMSFSRRSSQPRGPAPAQTGNQSFAVLPHVYSPFKRLKFNGRIKELRAVSRGGEPSIPAIPKFVLSAPAAERNHAASRRKPPVRIISRDRPYAADDALSRCPVRRGIPCREPGCPGSGLKSFVGRVARLILS